MIVSFYEAGKSVKELTKEYEVAVGDWKHEITLRLWRVICYFGRNECDN